MNNRKTYRSFRPIILLAVCTGFLATARADLVEIVDGSSIQGTILALEEGIVRIKTAFAKDPLEIDQSQITSITTDGRVNLALPDGNMVSGRIETTPSGVRVSTGSGALQTSIPEISNIWLDGDPSPGSRIWAYDVALDVNGRSGNSDRFYVGLTGSAVLTGPDDRLSFYASLGQAEENDNTTQDDGDVGVDYSNHVTEKVYWYARTELGFDRVKDIDLTSKSAAGFGYDWLKTDKQSLEVRGGLGYRFENYTDGTDFSSVGLDFGLLHTYKFPWGKMSNTLTWAPSFEDFFGNYVINHHSTLDLPIKATESWKIRLGIANDYNSEPPSGLDELDTTYFMSLVYTWN